MKKLSLENLETENKCTLSFCLSSAIVKIATANLNRIK